MKEKEKNSDSTHFDVWKNFQRESVTMAVFEMEMIKIAQRIRMYRQRTEKAEGGKELNKKSANIVIFKQKLNQSDKGTRCAAFNGITYELVCIYAGAR